MAIAMPFVSLVRWFLTLMLLSPRSNVKVMGIKPLVPVARVVNREFGHRDSEHSLHGWVGWTGLVLPVGIFLGWTGIAALSLGYSGHLMADSATKSGIMTL